MLTVLVSSDFAKIQKRLAALLKDYEAVRFGEGAEPFSSVLSRLGAPGLFSAKIALVIAHPLDDAEGKALILERAQELADSDTPVVVITSALDAAAKKALPKKTEIEILETKEKEEFEPNAFALSDAYLKGDRKNSWVLYRRFIEGGTAAEEIHGVLSWAIRSLVLASKTKSAAEAGLKPFVYTKAKSALARIPNPEAVSRELLALYHRARSGGGSLENLLEIFLLKKGVK